MIIMRQDRFINYNKWITVAGGNVDNGECQTCVRGGSR